jgi:hypothetical protein
MNAKHTPGPREFDDKHSSGFPLLCLYAADNRNPFHGSRSDDEQNANARLIAAAPELLDALKDCIQLMKLDLEGLAFVQPELKKAMAAIEKATGEQA